MTFHIEEFRFSGFMLQMGSPYKAKTVTFYLCVCINSRVSSRFILVLRVLGDRVLPGQIPDRFF